MSAGPRPAGHPDGVPGALSEIAHALVRGMPVVGVGTWSIRRGRAPAGGIVPVDGPDEAVRVAPRLMGR